MGFCSQECYEKARLDGFVKEISWDKFDYKKARLEDVNSIASHLDRKLANTLWRHKTSQKEEDIVEC